MLEKQKIRNIEQIDACKLSVCHPHSAGIGLGSSENYDALSPEITAEMDIPQASATAAASIPRQRLRRR